MAAVTFLSLLHHAGLARTFWLYACICVVAFIFCCALVPETKRRFLEAIEHQWPRSGEKTTRGRLAGWKKGFLVLGRSCCFRFSEEGK